MFLSFLRSLVNLAPRKLMKSQCLQGISGTCQRSILHIERSMSSCYSRQQSLQLLVATAEWNSLHFIFCRPALRHTGIHTYLPDLLWIPTHPFIFNWSNHTISLSACLCIFLLNQLLDVILPLLKHLCEQKDVRPVLYEKFHMPEWFQKQGIPTSCWTS